MLQYILSVLHLLKSFCHEWILNFVFFVSIDDHVFIFHSINVTYHTNSCAYDEPSLQISGMNPT